MYKYFLLLSLLLFNVTIFGQNKEIDIKVANCFVTNKDVTFSLIITNISDTLITTYLPHKEDICLSVLKICITDKQTGKEYDYFPCTSIADLDHIVLDSLNTISLNSQDSYEQKFIIPRKKFKHVWRKKDNYQLYVGWYFHYVRFECPFSNVFNESIESNKIDISIVDQRKR
jgi:hypothetical protein